MSDAISASIPIDLQALADELLTQSAGEHSRRAARTLPHPVDGLRQTVIALSENARLSDHNSPGPASLVVLRGRATLIADGVATPLETHQHVAIPPRRHSLSADGDAVVLLSVAVTVRLHPSPGVSAERHGPATLTQAMANSGEATHPASADQPFPPPT